MQRLGKTDGLILACASHAWLLVLLLSCASATAGEAKSTFSPEAWRKAADPQSGNWTREPLCTKFAGSTDFGAMSRAQIIRSLGEPGVAQRIYSPGEGLVGRVDFYRLSAKNEDSFRMEYDTADKVTGHLIDARACACELCTLTRADAGSVRMEALEGFILKKDAEGVRRSMSLSEVERGLGLPGQHHTDEAEIGGRTWVIYSALWPVADKPHTFFIATGSLPKTEQTEFGRAPVETLAVIEAWPECLPQ